MSSASHTNEVPVEVDTTAVHVRLKVAKPKRRIECKVCGDDATGYNFGAIVCESCKSFYRRHAHRKPNFRCASSGKCQLNFYTRRHCAACRLAKCFAVGMRRPPDEDDPFGRNGWSTEQHNQRKLLMSRLMQRIASRDKDNTHKSPPSPSPSPSPTADKQAQSSSSSEDGVQIEIESGVVFDYEELLTRVRAAATSLQSRTQRNASCNLERRDTSALIALALDNYTRALKHFPELLRLGERTLRCMLSERMLEQLNLYSLFTVSWDVSGWSAFDATGVSREQRFFDFVHCLSRDGLDANDYVEAFRDLAKCLRSRFEVDWPTVLVIVTLTDLCGSPYATVDAELSSVERVRHTFESFLKCYLERHYASESESLLRFCKDQFRTALGEVVATQRKMLFGVAVAVGVRSESSLKPNDCQFGSVSSSESAVGYREVELLDPIVFHVAGSLF